jgi:hypothetical protein|tara:strand:- start:100 stop:324 length:225 start_codon:yes stop_codon:yes gene_type:complete
MSDWLDKLAGEAIADKAPKGFYSVRQIMKIKGYSRRHTLEILRKELDIGRIRMVKVRIKAVQREYPTPHYGPAK